MCSHLPLVRWAAPRPRRRLGAVAILGLITGLTLSRPHPWLVWNASASAPIGLYWLSPHAPPRVGDMVVARTPSSVRGLAAERHYLPAGVPLVKRVAAADGDVVCAIGPQISIDGRPAAGRRVADRLGRPLPWWDGCRKLVRGDVFLLMPAPDSLDSRYFGPLPASALLGRATPLWVR